MKNKFWKIIGILFVISIIIGAIKLISEEQELFTQINDNRTVLLLYLWAFFISFIMNVIGYAFIMGGYYFIKFIERKVRREKMTKIDLQKYDGYYRDILNEYDVAALSYIDDFKFDYKRDIVSVLLNLKKKGKINFDKKRKIIVITDKEVNLTKVEEYIINNVVNGKINISNYYNNVVIQEASDMKLLKISINKVKFKRTFFVLIVLYLLNIFIFHFLANRIIDETIFILLILLFVLLLFLIPGYGIVYFFIQIFYPYRRTELGEDINIKLKGLKNYLEDFSSLEKKDIEHLIIWDEYLIYSVLFNQNKKIVEEIYQDYFIK